MTPDQIRTVIEQFGEARNAQDRDHIASLVTDDVEHVLPRSIGRPPMQGDAVVDGLAGGLAGQFFDMSTVKREVKRITVEGDVAAVEQTMTGTTLKGKEYVNDYVWIYEIRDGKIARIIEHLDTLIGARTLETL
jgi:ketosteroid isomerase-like protein